jgi:hypothetical protein
MQFETCESKLEENLPNGMCTSSIMTQGNLWSFKHTHEGEIDKIIKSLMNKNSSGPDSLTNRMSKRAILVCTTIKAIN